MTAKTIEYFYSAHSAYAYIGSKRLMEIAAAAGRQLLHRPVHLSPVVTAVGGKSFAERTKPHVDYFFGREIERWAEFRGVPIVDFRPTYHDEDMTLASCMLIAAQDQGLEVDRLAHAILEVHWRDDADISDPKLLRDLTASLGMDGQALAEAANSPAVLKRYQDNTAEAIARSVFGSPTYFVDGDMHYGQDHLELMEALQLS